MAKAKSKPGPAPLLEDSKLKLTPYERAKCSIAADILAEAFQWDKHPWGDETWWKIHEELKRMGAKDAA